VEELRRSIIEVDLENQVRVAMDSNAELDQFASIISHDMKEPLRGIAHYADFLLEDTADLLNEESLSHLQGIRQLTEKTRDLISNLYEYSKVATIDMAFADVDMDLILGDVAERLAAYLAENDAELRIKGPLPGVFCDGVRVCEVFANLITNAVKYNDQSAKWIEVGANLAGGVPVFYVKDNGIGIQPHNKERIFAMFQRLHTEEAYGGGSGIGLAIVKRIIDRHGGRIWLDSYPGEGTTFFFTLRPPAQQWQVES
jgi:chemotaxis family two-component system sensor kinase Cph1